MWSFLYHHHSQEYFFNWNILTSSPYLEMLLISNKIIVRIYSQWSQCSMLLLVICGGFNSRRLSYLKTFSLFLVLIAKYVVATFNLHYLGYRIKYGNLEVGNTTKQLLSAARPCCSIEFIESFLFWVILVTYNIAMYIYL